MGLLLMRVSELPSRCDVVKDPSGELRIPAQLPFRRVRGTASFQASTRWAGGHFVAMGWRDDEGRVGLLQFEVPPERGYQIAEYPNRNLPQTLAFAEWQQGRRRFAAQSLVGYLNYFPSEVPELDFLGKELPSRPDKKPGKSFVQAALDGKDDTGAEVCWIIGVHAAADRPRDLPYDPSWFQPRPSLHIVSQDDALIAPTLEELDAPTEALVAPGEAPADPGTPAPRMERRGSNEFAGGGGSSSPCD